jgi:hypothetical protein
MTIKRVKIPFNFELWGKENISVDDIMGRLVVKLHENPIKDEFYGIAHDGSTFALPVNKLTMYQEVKPREIWVNEYSDLRIGGAYSSIEKAKHCGPNAIRQVKFIEVLE